jgi:flagellar assembly factor FliW
MYVIYVFVCLFDYDTDIIQQIEQHVELANNKNDTIIASFVTVQYNFTVYAAMKSTYICLNSDETFC